MLYNLVTKYILYRKYNDWSKTYKYTNIWSKKCLKAFLKEFYKNTNFTPNVGFPKYYWLIRSNKELRNSYNNC